MQRVIALLVAAWVLGAQEPPKPRRDVSQPPGPAFYPIEGLGVEGNKLYTAAQIIGATGLRVGAPGGKILFEAARDRLLASGYFTSVGYRFESAPGQTTYLASFQVEEVPEVYAWRIEDLPVTRDEFERYARQYNPMFGPKIPASEQALAFHRRLLQELVNKRGAPTQVVSKIEPEGKDQLTIVFRPNTPRPTIAEVRFTGNKKVETRFLMQAISPIAVGAPWYEPRFREYLANQITPIYEARGLMRVSYPKIATEQSTSVRGLVVTVDVAEGEQFNLSRLEVTGTQLDGDDLQRELQVKLDEQINISAIAAGMERVMKRLKNTGYLKAAFTAQRRINDSTKTVEVFVRVNQGPQFAFRKLTILGLDLESEPAIRKLWALKEGEPYRANYPDYFLERVREDGIFDNLGKTAAEAKIDEAANAVDVVLTFKGEGPSGRRRRTPN